MFYSEFMHMCGFDIGQEGKLMGLAPYGSPTYLKELWNFVELKPNHIRVFTDRKEKMDTFKEMVAMDRRDQFQVRADLAYATQYIFEECIISILNDLYDQTHCDRLCYSGGAALNSVLNGKIASRTRFKDIYIFPAAGDSGTSIGAALYGYYGLMKPNESKGARISHCFFGKTYGESEIESAIQSYSLAYDIVEFDSLTERVAMDLSTGKIVGWFQGGAESGPRALGNRSILCDPRDKEMKDILNLNVKFRENFRPFAPVVLEDRVHEYFDCVSNNEFMLFVGQVKPSKKTEIPAVTHVDGSARLQTVNKTNNQKLYSLIEKFYEKTSVPILLNTSFNIEGKPIVETPQEAIEAFLNSGMDVLVMWKTYIRKKSKTDSDKRLGE